MKTQPSLDPDDVVGDFEALLRQLESPQDPVMLSGGYAGLLALMASNDFRHRAGCNSAVPGAAS